MFDWKGSLTRVNRCLNTGQPKETELCLCPFSLLLRALPLGVHSQLSLAILDTAAEPSWLRCHSTSRSVGWERMLGYEKVLSTGSV